MKKLVTIAVLGLMTFASCKQDAKNAEVKPEEKAAPMEKKMTEEKMPMKKVKTISLTQTAGEFMTKELSLTEGTYVFEIANKDVDHNVGFVLAPKGKTDQANHIKAAYVKAPVATGSTSLTNEVTLAKGEYVYFCPLNPTPHYNLVVK